MRFSPFKINKKQQEPIVIVATGGTITDISDGGEDYRVHTFTSSGTFEVISGNDEIEFLIIAGGGGGGNNAGAGGGAGGYISSVVGELSGGLTQPEPKIIITTGNYPIIIGAGGAGGSVPNNIRYNGDNGSNSSAFNLVSIGGGGGSAGGAGRDTTDGVDGGSGGGSASWWTDQSTWSFNGFGGLPVTGQGFRGSNTSDNDTDSGYFNGGGGGGAGSQPNDIMNLQSHGGALGGVGIQSNINGTPVYRAGGGAGFFAGPGSNSLGGTPQEGDGIVNSGAGGGGGGIAVVGSGGSGIVIIRYKI